MAAEDDSDIPDTGAVFTFGKSKFADNLPNKFWVRNDQVREVACGDEHTALVAESGRVFTFGANDWGQLGLGTTTTADRPSCIKSLKSEKVRLVGCGRTHTIVATESGKIYAFGSNNDSQLGVDDSPDSNIPKCIDSLVTQDYKMLAAGVEHSMALTAEGAVYVWGSNGEGQLGIDGKTECPEPEELPIEDVVTCISCGYYHSAIVTESGDLYTFGESEGGKLGHGEDPDDTDKPQKVSIPEKVISVACGNSHTAAVTENGNVYTFGDGPSGQLGHGTHCLQVSTPRKVNLSFKVSKVSCGDSHTAFISEKGQMYTCGDGRHGKLALGQESFSNQFLPVRVKRFSDFVVQKVSCGGCHMICLAKLRQDGEDPLSSDDEVIHEPKMNGILNHTLKADGSIDLNNSVTARDRRRKHNDSFKNDLNRTLPALAGAKNIHPEVLHATVPAVKSRKLESQPNQNQNHTAEDASEGEEVKEEVIKAEAKEEVTASPKLPPRPLPRKHPESEQSTHEDSDSEREESEEEESEEEKVEPEESTVKRKLPMAPIPPPRHQPKPPDMSRSEGEESEKEEKHEEKKEEKQEKAKGKKKKKDKNFALFGRKKTGLSDDEAEDEEEEEEEEEEKEDEKPVKAKHKKDEDEEDDDEEKDKKKDKKKEKKTKKGKKDKKKGKKKKEEDEEEEEEEEEEDEEEEKDKKKGKKKDKDKKKDKKDKKKDKKKEDKEEEEEEEEEENKDEKKKDKKKVKKKDKDKDKKDEDQKDKEEEKDKKDEKKSDDEKAKDVKDDKKNDKPAEPPKKKSRTCTIL